MEAPGDKPLRTAQRRPGVVSLVMWAKPPAADCPQPRRPRRRGERYERGRAEVSVREVGGPISEFKQAGCLLFTTVLGRWHDGGSAVSPRATVLEPGWPDTPLGRLGGQQDLKPSRKLGA